MIRRLALAVIAFGLSLPGHAADAGSIEGHYFLEGVMETGSELLLKPDGTFQYYLVYGALDQFAHGIWSNASGTVILNAQTPATGFSIIDPQRLGVIDIPQVPDRGTILVTVINEERDARLSHVPVTARFADGRTASSETDNEGSAIISIPPGAEGKLVRLGLAFPQAGVPIQWLDLSKSPNVQWIAVNFEPGALAPPPFKTLRLKPGHNADGQATLEADMGDNRHQWIYVRHRQMKSGD